MLTPVGSPEDTPPTGSPAAPTVFLVLALVALLALQVLWLHRFRFGFVTFTPNGGSPIDQIDPIRLRRAR